MLAVFLFTLLSGFANAQTARAQELEPQGETRLSATRPRVSWLVPLLSAQHFNFSFGQTAVGPGAESDPAVEVGLRLFSTPDRMSRVLAGLDLRQTLAQNKIYGTRLGLCLRWFSKWNAEFSASGYFGDTVVVQSRSLQFNGNSVAISAAYPVGAVRLYIEGAWGGYSEGPGFIFLTRRAGVESLGTRSISIGAEVPFEVSFLNGLPAEAEDRRVRPSGF